MKETEEQAIERRKKLYGCNGRCYCNGICGGIDTCEETRNGEATGICLAILIILSMPVVLVLLIAVMILGGR